MAKTRKSKPGAETLSGMQMLELVGIDAICERILDGESQAAIARSLHVQPSHFCEWLASDVERSARAREARTQSADAYADRAEQVLRDAESNQIEISRARELASHYRWMASKRRPAEYGDKVTQEISGKDGGAIVIEASERPRLSKEEWMAAHGIKSAA